MGRNATLLVRDGVPQVDLLLHPVEEDRKPVAAASERPARAGEVLRRAEARGRDAVGWIQCGREDARRTWLLHEEAEERHFSMMVAEEADEASIMDSAAPTLAYGGGAREGGRLRWEVEEDLRQEVLVV